MTEAEARSLLASFDGVGGIERWIAGRRWKVTTEGWTVTGELEGWSYRVVPVPGGVQVSASAPGGAAPAVWRVLG
jgi:hypothetical protein